MGPSAPTPAQRSLSTAEAPWLAYAREVLTDSKHLDACWAMGGSPNHPGVDATDLRWPGYLGAQARPGEMVVAVGNIHRNFASGTLGVSHRDQLVRATRGWRDGTVSDVEYLAETRAVYLAGLTAWTVGKHLRYALGVLGLDLRSIAYLNAARCQFPELPPALPGGSRIKPALQRLCLSRFPLGDLAGFLRPRFTLFTSTSAYDAALDSHDDEDSLRVCLHQLNGTLARPLTVDGRRFPVRTRREVWAQALVDVGPSGAS